MSAKEQYKNGVTGCQPRPSTEQRGCIVEVKRLVHPVGALAAVCVGQVMLPFLSAIGINSLGNRIAVDTEGFGRVRNAFLVSSESFLNVELFKLVKRFIQKDVAIEHVFDYCF